jgi:hypothetical protein
MFVICTGPHYLVFNFIHWNEGDEIQTHDCLIINDIKYHIKKSSQSKIFNYYMKSQDIIYIIFYNPISPKTIICIHKSIFSSSSIYIPDT